MIVIVVIADEVKELIDTYPLIYLPNPFLNDHQPPINNFNLIQNLTYLIITKVFGADKMSGLLENFRVADDMPIESDLVVQVNYLTNRYSDCDCDCEEPQRNNYNNNLSHSHLCDLISAASLI